MQSGEGQPGLKVVAIIGCSGRQRQCPTCLPLISLFSSPLSPTPFTHPSQPEYSGGARQAFHRHLVLGSNDSRVQFGGGPGDYRCEAVQSIPFLTWEIYGVAILHFSIHMCK